MKTLTKREFEEHTASNDNAVIINALAPEYFEKEHIPGSINIPHDAPDFLKKVEALGAEKDQEIIVYCASKQCDASEKAAGKLEKAGYKNVYDFAGGMDEWKQAGGKVESGRA